MSSGFQSTHRTLNNVDILYQIINFLNPQLHQYQPPKREIRACARLARVCKAFTTPALDALWTVQYDFDPIFALLPEL